MIIEPEGLGRSLRDVSIAFLVLTWAFVVARLAIRIRIKYVGVDDYSMIGGLVLFTVVCIATIVSAYYGVGARDSRLTPELNKQAPSTVPIKASICVTLMRITPSKVYRFILYAIIAFGTVSAIITDIGLLVWCKPIAATWDPAKGHCGKASFITALGYFISSSTIVTDWSCSVIPILLVWNLNMRVRMKVSVAVILALGVLASTANLIRLQYVISYQSTVDYLYGIAHIALWSIVESGTGIIAGSMPALAPVIKYIPIIGSGFGNSDRAQQHENNMGPSFRLSPMRNQSSTICEASQRQCEECSNTESQRTTSDGNNITVRNAFIISEHRVSPTEACQITSTPVASTS